MEPIDETHESWEDLQRQPSEHSPPQEGGASVPAAVGSEHGEVPARDLGSLAIGGTIGGILAAKGLKGTVGSGAKSLAAGFLAKQLQKSRSPGTDEPAEPLPVEKAPIEPEPEPIAVAGPATEVDDDEMLVPTGDGLTQSGPGDPDVAKSFADEVREAEDELEESLLAGDGIGSVSDPEPGAARGGLFDEPGPDAQNVSVPQARPPGLADNAGGRSWAVDPLETVSDSTDAQAEPEETTDAPPRSPFLRDHTAGAEAPPAPKPQQPIEDQSPAEPTAGFGVPPAPIAPVDVPPAAEPQTDIAGPPAGWEAAPARPSELPPEVPASAAPPVPLPAPPQPELPPASIPPPRPATEPEEPAVGDAAPPPSSVPAAEPSLPPPPAAPLPPAEEPATILPGIAPTELPQPSTSLPPVDPAPEAAAEIPETPQVQLPPKRDEGAPPPSSFTPTPIPTESALPPEGAVLPPPPPVEKPITPAGGGQQEPLTEIPLQSQPQPTKPPAKPLGDVSLISRSELTPAEIAARERADKLAKKKKKGGERDAAPGLLEVEKKSKKASGKKKSRPEKSKAAKKSEKPAQAKRKKPGGVRRLLVVGLPLVAVLGAAGTYGYLNKEKFGFGEPAADDPGGVPAAPAVEVEPERKDPIIPENIFEDPGHVLPGQGDPQDPVEPDDGMEPPPALQVTDEERLEILRDPKRTLEAFLLAGTVEELVHYVADRELVEPDIRAHYEGGKRTPVATQAIQFEDTRLIPGTAHSAYMYWVTSMRRKIPVSVEETSGGYKVDWAAFTQFHDAKLEKFIRNPGSAGGGFYVQLRRSHYFGNDIADIDDLQPFRVQSPIAPFTDSYVFLRKSNPEAKAILDRYRWVTGYRPFVELKWVTPPDGDPRIELVRVVRHTWRRQKPDGYSSPESSRP